jgi:tetratricopeptide (TPR) repeat protein
LNYQVDVEAFWEFVQSVSLVDGLRTLDDRIRFFETACQKDPVSPYVRQHYARMFMRAGHLQLALKEIDAAIDLNAEVRVLYHTKGLILADLAMKAPSDELARRRLVQSEDAFNRCIGMDHRDDYGYTGLAEIYLKWARRAKNDDESNEYVAKAEGVISEGLKAARNHEQLWIVSSEIEKFLGFEPKRVEALERALGSVAASRSARYLLGRYYRSKGRPSEALSVLKPALDNFPDDYRLFIEYANAMLEDGETFGRAAAVLQLASLTGMRDARYVANLGGMLFMSGDYTESERIFAATADRSFSFAEATRSHFVPSDPENRKRPMRLVGKVAAVKPGYTFIDSGSMPSFFHYGTKAGGVVLREGLDVSFEPAFSARGRMAQGVIVATALVKQKRLFSPS